VLWLRWSDEVKMMVGEGGEKGGSVIFCFCLFSVLVCLLIFETLMHCGGVFLLRLGEGICSSLSAICAYTHRWFPC
jgi:hypothetical protein